MIYRVPRSHGCGVVKDVGFRHFILDVGLGKPRG